MSAREIDIHTLPSMLTALRLPSFHKLWAEIATSADTEGWPAARFLAVLAEYELAERDMRRIRRHLNEAQLPAGKTLATFDFKALPTLPRARVEALAAGDWLDGGGNLIAIGNSGTGKTHILCAIGHALIEAGQRVFYTRTSDLVQRLQAARRDLVLEAALTKLDKFDLIILDDITYAHKDQAETGVLFELIARRYEYRSIAIAANQPFSGWDQIFPDKAMTVAAIDRLVHHASILEMNAESFRQRAAASNKRAQAEAPATTITDNQKKEQPNPENRKTRQPQRPQNRPRWLSAPDKVVDALHPPSEMVVAGTETPLEQTLLEDVRKNALWFSVGANDAPTVYAFIDPTCMYSASAIAALSKKVGAGELQLRVVLAPVISDRSPGLIAAILNSDRPPLTFFDHEVALAEQGRSDLVPGALTDLPGPVQAGIQRNFDMVRDYGIPGVPFFVYETTEGAKVLSGSPEGD